jgi:hypothetical protein
VCACASGWGRCKEARRGERRPLLVGEDVVAEVRCAFERCDGTGIGWNGTGAGDAGELNVTTG